MKSLISEHISSASSCTSGNTLHGVGNPGDVRVMECWNQCDDSTYL